MDIQQNGAVAAVAACLRNGGKAFGLDAEQWADILLMAGEPQDLYDRLAAMLEPQSPQSDEVRQVVVNEIIDHVGVTA